MGATPGARERGRLAILSRLPPAVEVAAAAGLVTTLLTAASACGGSSSTGTAGAACHGVVVTPAQNVAAVVAGNPGNTTFCLSAGVFRGATIKPKSGDEIAGAGQGRTVLDGAAEVTAAGQQGSLSFAPVPGAESGQQNAVHCVTAHPLCWSARVLYAAGRALQAVTSTSTVTSGTFFFDPTAHRVWFSRSLKGPVEFGAATVAVTSSRSKPETDDGASDVTVRDLTVQHYAQTAQEGTIITGDRWTVRRVTAQDNAGQGFQLWGAAVTLADSSALRNGQLGVSASGGDGQMGAGHAVRGMTLTGDVISANNTAGYDAGWEAGGTKFYETRGTVVSGTRVTDNDGPGLWDDGWNSAITYRDDTVSGNTIGIFDELGDGATISGNVLTGNAGPGGSVPVEAGADDCRGAICVSSSTGARVRDNTVRDNGRGIVVVDGPHQLPVTGLTVTGNAVTGSGKAIALALTNESSPSLVFTGNHYSAGEVFGFGAAVHSLRQWQATGRDATGGLVG